MVLANKRGNALLGYCQHTLPLYWLLGAGWLAPAGPSAVLCISWATQHIAAYRGVRSCSQEEWMLSGTKFFLSCRVSVCKGPARAPKQPWSSTKSEFIITDMLLYSGQICECWTLASSINFCFTPFLFPMNKYYFYNNLLFFCSALPHGKRSFHLSHVTHALTQAKRTVSKHHQISLTALLFIQCNQRSDLIYSRANWRYTIYSVWYCYLKALPKANTGLVFQAPETALPFTDQVFGCQGLWYVLYAWQAFE